MSMLKHFPPSFKAYIGETKQTVHRAPLLLHPISVPLITVHHEQFFGIGDLYSGTDLLNVCNSLLTAAMQNRNI